MNLIAIQTNVSGFSGKPVSLFSAYNPDDGVLIVDSVKSYMSKRATDCIFISSSKDEEYDVFIEQSELLKTIPSFFKMKNSQSIKGGESRIIFSKKSVTSSPASSIEEDSIVESGVKYRISESISNAHVAVLATCDYAYNYANEADNIIDLFSAVNPEIGNLSDNLLNGIGITI